MLLPWRSPAVLAATAVLLLPAQPVIAAESSRASNDSLLWGPYRPNLYFGVRPRIPKSLMTGLLWSKLEDISTPMKTFRSTCEQTEEMQGYGWDEYDSRTGGRQVIHDAANDLDLTTEFVRIPGGEHGGSWGARISGKLRAGAPAGLKSTVVFTVALEGDGELRVGNEYDIKGYAGNVVLKGRTEALGAFTLDVTPGTGNRHPQSDFPLAQVKPLDRTVVASYEAPEQSLWQTKPIMFQEMKKGLEVTLEELGKEYIPPAEFMFLLDNIDAKGASNNLHFIQKVFEGSFEFDILFSSDSAPKPVDSATLTQHLKSSSKDFHARYDKVFKATAPFDDKKYDAFAKSLFSNLLGGIGYFHGDQLIDRSYAAEYEEDEEGFWEDAAAARARTAPKQEGPYSLFTAVPSRPFFPRGFLWDEGFHLLPVADWDVGLTLDVLRSWFATMDDDGWIPREQILGLEARSKVPPEFAVQYPHYANPPTLFTVIELLLTKVKAGQLPTDERDAVVAALKQLYPRLKRNYAWYRKTQRGDVKTYDRAAFSSREAYRWRGRTPSHILTSGLDDYPRAQPPHPGELHVDLIAWMGLMARNMAGIAEALGERDDAVEFRAHETAIARNIDDLHWDPAEQTFCDATVDEYEESVHECHKGYISIFPFLTGMLPPDSPRLGAILDLLADPEQLWSPHGIRSLSRQDAAYATGEDYWRSPVWINMNYLVVDNLLKVAQAPGPHSARAARLYSELRQNLVETVFASYGATGFAWEQYNPDSGAGQRTQHFTGWTSLVVKLMCMPDLRSRAAAPHEEL